MEPLLSVICTTYNHEDYIEDSIKSILLQETSFPFEIIIHDDASTDKTTKVIKKYQDKYPEKIKPIYQLENQYSKGKKTIFECALPKANGKYIAFCEGDDFWVDRHKLQKQVEFLSNNHNYSACFHGVMIVDVNKTPLGTNIGPVNNGSKDYTMNKLISTGFMHISSLVMRNKFIEERIPEWAIDSRHEDYALALIVAASGKVYFIDSIMSAYRRGVPNSLMTKMRMNYTNNNRILVHQQRIRTLTQANEYYNFTFENDIRFVIFDSEITLLLLESKYMELFSRKYKAYFLEKGFINTIKIILLVKAPNLAKRLYLLKGRINAKKLKRDVNANE